MSQTSRYSTVPLIALAVVVLVTPLAWRGVLWAWGPPASSEPPSYLPVLEATRERKPFIEEPIGALAGVDPGIVIVSDSMGGRIEPQRLGELANMSVVPILQNATGSAYWYFAFKNYVVASGIRPKWVLFFFRDTLLTDPTFRLTGPYRQKLDEVAREREDELNTILTARANGPWYSLHRLAATIYGTDRARDWLEPSLSAGTARAVGGKASATLLETINDAFTLDKLRSMPQADLAAEERDADFNANVTTSVLPAMLALAKQHGLRLGFVRVLRRPVNGEPPPESAALQRYVVDLRAYLEAHGATLIDDRDEPELAQLPYADGDHIAREALVPYTDRFWARLSKLPQ